MHQYKILNYYFYHYVIIYIKIIPLICVTMYSCMIEQIRISIHKQMIQLNIYQTHMDVWCKINLLQLDNNNKYVF